MVRSVSVQVAGQTLKIRTGATDAELAAIVDLVDGRVGEIRAAAPSAPVEQVLVLTAISLADELRRASQELERLRASVTEEAQGALRFLEDDGEPG